MQRHVRGVRVAGGRSSKTKEASVRIAKKCGDRLRTQNLYRVLLRDKVDDFESMLNDPDRHDLLPVVPSIHHKPIQIP